MLFNSLEFAVFFPAVALLYGCLPRRHRWAGLLAASCVFYAAFIPAYLLILLFIIVVDYVAARLIEQSIGLPRRVFLWTSICANVAILGTFKYYGFLTANVSALAGALGHPFAIHALQIALPIGLSFHTFQAMSYTIEVYRGAYSAERHLGIYALYVMFFPQLVAGPIERPGNLLPQLHVGRDIDPNDVSEGLKLMAWGFFKKLAIADRLAEVVRDVFARPSDYHGPALLLAAVFFAFQVYCDFSGYSDIAIGAAQVLGIRLMTNFRRPFLSTSVAEFWTRWHISLSSWFRDYVYIPLGGNRVARERWFANLLVVFLLSGLWHGASWTFVVWGGLNGLFLMMGIWTKPIRGKLISSVGFAPTSQLLRLLRTAATFSLICTTFVFFRAGTFHDAIVILTGVTRFTSEGLAEVGAFGLLAAYGICAIAFLVLVESLQPSDDPRDWVRTAPVWVRWSVYHGLLGAIIMFGAFGGSPFIYFQF